MSLHHNNQNPAQLYVGNTAVSKVYLGNTEVWPNALPPSGDISIVVSRSKLQCAPDSIGFSVDLSSSNFDTPAPANSTSYDRQFHELEYYWTFGDPGNWTAPEKTLPAHKNRNFAYGAFTRHMYRNPGTYTVTVTIVEPASGKTATATTTVTVEDPNTVFPTTRTICVNAIGDNDFTAAPVGAQTFNQNSLVSGDAVLTAALAQSGTGISNDRVRILFKAGWQGLVSANISAIRSVSFGTYGGSAKAIFELDRSRWSNGINVMGCIYRGGSPWGDYADLRCDNIRFQGDFDETENLVYESPGTVAIRGLSAHRYIIHNCVLDGWQGSTVAIEPQQTPERDGPDAHIVHLDDCIVSNFGGQYPLAIFAAAAQIGAGSSLTYTGIRIARGPDALTEFEEGQRALSRQSASDFVHIRGCDMYNSDGVQPVLKLVDGDADGYTRAVVHSNYMESVGLTVIDVAFTGNGRPTPYTNKALLLNALFESNVIVGGWKTKHVVLAYAAGMTWRNNLLMVPPGPYYGSSLIAMFLIDNLGNVESFSDWSTRIYNNTLVSLRSTSDTDTLAGGLWMVQSRQNNANVSLSTLGITYANNIEHQPNIDSPTTPYSPLSSNTILTARNEGFRPTFHMIVTVLGVAVPNGGSYTVSCDNQTEYLVVNSSKHKLVRINGAAPSFSLAFGVNEVTVTNTGSEWPAGSTMELKLFNAPGHYRAKLTAYASGGIRSYTPQAGSPAIGGASGLVAYRSLSSIDTPRGNNPSIGAWE